MSQQPVIWLANVLEDAGCKVKRYPGWLSRGRPETSGGFHPVALLIHHTGTPTSMARPAPTVPMCITGRSDLPGPLCQAVLGFDGLYHVIAAGRANHAGTARASGPVPGGDGNALYIGIEVDYSGSQDMGPLQYAALVKGSAAILKKLGRSDEWARGHKETSSAGKWDPGRKGSSSPEYRMAGIRADIAAALAPPPVKYAYVIHNADDPPKQLARSEPVSSLEKPRKARLGSWLRSAAIVDILDAEFEGDKPGTPRDVLLRRVKA